MKMNFGESFQIEDLGNHPAVSVVRLAILLAGTVNATPDPRRACCYEIDGGPTVYYIYVSPLSGTISLITSWSNPARSAPEFELAGVSRSRAETAHPLQ